jgi:thiol-disulfide isomerase/thioredoxin
MVYQYVRGEQMIDELIGFIQTPECTLSADNKSRATFSLESVIRLEVGRDPKLYGKTLDNKEFKWEDLRKKYVLIKFTATWCLPCRMEIPGMLEAYEKYRDQGFEIVSVYAGEHGTESEQIEGVKKAVKAEKLPWIVISEALTEKSKQPPQGDFYYIGYTPLMILVDREGKVIAKDVFSSNGTLRAKLADLFK